MARKPYHIDPQVATERGRKGAAALHARHDARETTKAGRQAFLARFETEEARQAYFTELSRKGVQVRAERCAHCPYRKTKNQGKEAGCGTI